MTDESGKKFASPLERARSGKIGGGKSGAPTQERYDAETSKHLNVETQERLNAEAFERPRGSEPVEDKKPKREDTHFRQTVWMPKTLNRRLKIQAAKEEQDISSIINGLVEQYLNRMED